MSTPRGYSGASAIAMVQLRTNEYTYPVTSDILTLLNAGVEQVEVAVGGIRKYQSYPTVNTTPLFTVDDDVQDIITASFSTLAPTAQGSLVYPLQVLEQATFMDAAAGFPAVGFGPPQAMFFIQDYGTGPSGDLPPPPRSQVQPIAGTSAVAQTIYTVVTWVNAAGESLPSNSTPCTVTTSLQGSVISPPPLFDATGYNVYCGTSDQGPFYKQNATAVAIGTNFTIPSTLLAVTQPPTTATATYASGGTLVAQLYPTAMQGQVNLYYRARPQLWADTTSNSFTNLDSLAQEAVIVWTMAQVFKTRGRSDEAAAILAEGGEYEAIIERAKAAIQRRTAPKWGQVRDTNNRAYPNAPYWWF